MQSLNYLVKVTIDTFNHGLSDARMLKEWEAIKKRIEKAAKGRSKIRTVSVI